MGTIRGLVPRTVLVAFFLASGSAHAQSGLLVDGVIESQAGGFRFPDGSLQSAAWSGYGGVVTVAASGADFTSIQAALDSITDASDTNRYVVRVGPGVYDEQLTMKSFVDVEGSGQLATRVTSAFSPTLVCASDAELRFLTVASTAASGTAISCNGTSPRLTHLSVWIQGASGTCRGVHSTGGAMPLVRAVEVLENSTCSTANGLDNDMSHPSVDGLEVTMLGEGTRRGILNEDSSPTVRNARFEILVASGTVYAVENRGASSSVLQELEIRLDGTTVGGIRDYDQSASTISGARMVLGPSTSISYGARTSGSQLRVERTSVEIIGGGSGFGYGIYADGGVDLRLSNVVLDVLNHAFTYGVYLSASTLEAHGLDITSDDGSFDYGVYLTAGADSWDVWIDGSTIRAADETIRGDAEFTVRVGGSRLAGDPVDARGGTITCAGVWDENYTFFASSCP